MVLCSNQTNQTENRTNKPEINQRWIMIPTFWQYYAEGELYSATYFQNITALFSRVLEGLLKMEDLFCLRCCMEWEYLSVLLLPVTRTLGIQTEGRGYCQGRNRYLLLSISRLCCLQKFLVPVRRQEWKIWCFLKIMSLKRSRYPTLWRELDTRLGSTISSVS